MASRICVNPVDQKVADEEVAIVAFLRTLSDGYLL